MIEDQNPLRTALEKELDESDWLQKFQSISQLLQSLKADVSLTERCKLEWISENQTLLIHCPTAELQQALKKQASDILRINNQIKKSAKHIILKHAQHEDVL